MSPTPSPRAAFTAAAAAAGVVLVLTSSVAFAASGRAPWSHQDVAGTAGDTTSHLQPAHPSHPTHPAHPTHPVHPVHPAHPAGTDSTDITTGDEGDGPSEHGFQGLCHAYAAGQKATHGKALQAPPFVALVAAAGGAENVAAYCAALPAPVETDEGDAGAPTDHPTHPVHPTHPAHPSHPPHPTQGGSPTHQPKPTHPTHPTHPTTRPEATPGRLSTAGDLPAAGLGDGLRPDGAGRSVTGPRRFSP